MAKHIHIHVHRTHDAEGPKHAPAGSPKGGQFVSGSGGGSGGGKVNRPQHSPMRQANRNLEAQQLKESRKIAKVPGQPGVNPGVRQMQAKSDVEEAKKRIEARKAGAVGVNTQPDGSKKKVSQETLHRLAEIQAARREAGRPHTGLWKQAPSVQAGLKKESDQMAAEKATGTAHVSKAQAAPSPKIASPRSDSPALNASPAQRAAATKEFKVKQAKAEAKAHKDLESHPNYSKEDHTYLKDKGYDPGEIKALWDHDKKAGHEPQTKNKNSKEMQEHFAGTKKAMFG